MAASSASGVVDGGPAIHTTAAGAAALRIFTVGHSNHDAGPFLTLLRRHGVRALVDVRSIPSSGRFPHFKKRALDGLCQRSGVSYRHCPELGNKVGGIAQLLRQPEGQAALAALAAAAAEGHTAYMCAEADWRDCHRQVISQRLLTDYGITTTHILRDGSTEPHPRDHVLPAHYGMAVAYAPPSSCAKPCCLGDAELNELSLASLSLEESATAEARAGGAGAGGGGREGSAPVEEDAQAGGTAPAAAAPAKARRWGRKA